MDVESGYCPLGASYGSRIMYAYNRLGPGKPTSPRRSPRARHGKSKFAGSGGGRPESPALLQRAAQRFAYLLLSVVFRRHSVLLFAPLVYLSGMLLYMRTLPVEIPRVIHRPPRGSTYRSPEVFRRLWPYMQVDDSQTNALMTAWHETKGQTWMPSISKRTSQEEPSASNGYLIVEANGGLNQQRIS